MAKKSWKKLFSYVTGVVRYHDLVYVSMVADELSKKQVEHSYVTEWDNGVWRVGDDDNDRQDWDAVAATVVKKPLEQALFMGPAGQILCLGSGDTHEERIPAKDGPMRGIGAIEGEAYACGMGPQVYKRAGKKWTALSAGIAKPKKGEVRGFEAIAGLGKKDLYAVGWGGEIWHYDGKAWKQQESPVGDIVLTSICCVEGGDIYAAGQMGVLLKKTEGGWIHLKQKKVKDNIWSLAWFEGDLYASTMSDVFVLEKDQLVEVAFGKDKPKTCFHLSTADGVLWSIGPKDVLSFDGKKWKRID